MKMAFAFERGGRRKRRLRPGRLEKKKRGEDRGEASAQKDGGLSEVSMAAGFAGKKEGRTRRHQEGGGFHDQEKEKKENGKRKFVSGKKKEN